MPAPDPDPAPTVTGASPEQVMLFVQALRGAPASVLLALAFAGRFMSHKDLQLWTRCGKDQITLALRSLVQLGCVVARSTRGPWALARPLGIPGRDLFVLANPLKGPGSGGDSLNFTIEDSLPPNPSRKELHQTLLGAGIREPTASELAELPHVTTDYVHAHLHAARAHGLRLGAAIEAMRLAAPVPQLPSAASPADRLAQVEHKFRRFLEGA
jgi:hypothetical protein